MKSRAIQTRFWDDEIITELSQYAKYLYIYLLTCQYINVSGAFQLADKKIIFETGLTEKQFLEAKKELISVNKVKFQGGWIFVINAQKNNNYIKIPSNQKTFKDEWNKIPEKIKTYFQSDKSLPVLDQSLTSNGLNINNKQYNINTNNIINISKELLEFYNKEFNKNLRTVTFEKNLEHWLKVFTIKEIKEALINAKQNDFWSDKITPEKLLRTKSTKGENVCYIQDLLSNKKKPFKEFMIGC